MRKLRSLRILPTILLFAALIFSSVTMIDCGGYENPASSNTNGNGNGNNNGNGNY